jgi:hypothetical protein
MRTDPRLQRLRDLAARLEQLPASEARERMLTEVRSRAVDLDTGVKPRAMLPVEPLSMAGGGRRQREALATRSAAAHAVALTPPAATLASSSAGSVAHHRTAEARIAAPAHGEIAYGQRLSLEDVGLPE